MANIQEALKLIRENSANLREIGTKFEELIRIYLKNEPIYKDRYAKLYDYSQWAEQHGLAKRDAGIDLVAETKDNPPQYHAIQCKCYDENHKISKKDLDSFLAAAGSAKFSGKILVYSNNERTKFLDDNLILQENLTIINLEALENSMVDFLAVIEHKKEYIKQPLKLRPHQEEAIEAALKHFAKNDRGQMIMACGTGKTFTSLCFAHRFAGAGKKVAFFVPSLALMQQTITEWSQQAAGGGWTFIVTLSAQIAMLAKSVMIMKIKLA